MMNMDLSRVMDAYRGQEDKLKQRVQLSNDLLELIAYEQLTREKRQLMAAQQAQSGPPPNAPTIKEQKEQEALELTKQQLAQQIGGGLQQKAMQQQQAMRQGLAAAPGAQNAMPPKAMAAGGIVAFGGGGVVGYQSGGNISPEEIAQRLRSGEGLISLRRSILGEAPQSRNPQALIAWNERSKQFDAAVRQAQDLMRSGQPIAAPAEADAAAAPVRAMPPRVATAPARQANPPMIPGDEIDRTQMQMPPEEAPAPPAPAVPPAPAQTAIPQEQRQGILSALPSQPDNRTSDRLATMMGAQLLDARSARPNPMLQELSGIRGELASYSQQFPKESEESKRARAADQAALEARYAKMNDPQTQMLDRLQAFLAGGAGRRGIGSVLGGAGEASSRVRAQQEAQGLQALKDIQKGREEMRQRDVAEAREQYGVRGKTLELGSKIAEAASKIEAETNIADQRVAASMADVAIRSYTQHQGDMEKIKADLAKHAATLRYNISNDEVARIAQIAVAEIGAGARATAGASSRLADLARTRSTTLNNLQKDEQKEIEDNPALKSAMNAQKSGKQLSVTQQGLITAHEKKWGDERRSRLGEIDAEIMRLRGAGSAQGSPQRTGSAASQGVTVVGATPTR
jgi:hypothetical protein